MGLPDLEYIDNCVFQFYPILCSYRQGLLNHLFDNGIDTRILLNLTDQPIFKQLYGNRHSDYTFSNMVNNVGFLLPCHHYLKNEEVEYVIESINKFEA